jgi:DNA-binding NarL/FixJ family response regulator
MMRLGMSSVLADGGVEVYAEGDEAGKVVEEARRLLPDAVVLGRDAGAGRELGAQVREAAPNAKVILWARDETEMEVFDPGSAKPRRIRMGVPEALLVEVVGSEGMQ